METSQWNHFHCIKCICRIPKYESGQVSGSAGLVVSICMLCGGIVSIVSRKNNSKGTNIALLILFSLATLTGFVLAENYSDLYIWSAWCLINAVLAFISLRKGAIKI